MVHTEADLASHLDCMFRGDRVERAHLYKAPGETIFGFQVACKTIADGIATSKLAKEVR